jgi:hypothetical protein
MFILAADGQPPLYTKRYPDNHKDSIISDSSDFLIELPQHVAINPTASKCWDDPLPTSFDTAIIAYRPPSKEKSRILPPASKLQENVASTY